MVSKSTQRVVKESSTNSNLILALFYFEAVNNKCFTLRTMKTFKALETKLLLMPAQILLQCQIKNPCEL